MLKATAFLVVLLVVTACGRPAYTRVCDETRWEDFPANCRLILNEEAR